MASASETTEALIDRVYEAAAFPELWPEVLERVGGTVDAAGMILLASSSDRWSGTWAGNVSSPAHEPAMLDFLSGDVSARTQTTPMLLSLDIPGFASVLEGFSREAWEADPLHLEWCRPWGLGDLAATPIHAPSGEFLVLQVARSDRQPDFSREDLDRLDAFRPHIARAALLSARWRLEKLRAAAEALAAIGLPALIINAEARVLAANSLMEDMTGYVKWLARDGVALTDPAADRMLKLGLAGLAGPAPASVRSFAARSKSGGTPAVAHLVPTPGQSRDLFDGACAVLVLTPVSAPTAPDVALIRGLFDLTPKEARVARAITEGLTVNEMATQIGVGRETVRSQVKAVLGKTGTRHQREVAALFSGIPKLPLDGD